MRNLLREGLVTGSVAGVVSGLALCFLGRRENGSLFAPINAVSHWLWRDRAFRKNGFSLRYTVPGYLIHHAMSVFWGSVHAGVFRCEHDAGRPARALAKGAATAAVACIVDYQMTPQRLTPGFERRLSPGALGGVYLAFGVGLAIGCMLVSRKRRV